MVSTHRRAPNSRLTAQALSPRESTLAHALVLLRQVGLDDAAVLALQLFAQPSLEFIVIADKRHGSASSSVAEVVTGT